MTYYLKNFFLVAFLFIVNSYMWLFWLFLLLFMRFQMLLQLLLWKMQTEHTRRGNLFSNTSILLKNNAKIKNFFIANKFLVKKFILETQNTPFKKSREKKFSA